MLVAKRKFQILQFLAEEGFIEAAMLARRLGTSEATIRRDLTALGREGAVQRTRGGALPVSGPAILPFGERELRNPNEKRAIAERAAALVQDGETIIIDGGTTTSQMVRPLLNRQVQVITNSIPVAQALGNSRSVEVVMTGGWVYPRSGILLGPHAVASLRTMRARRAFISAAGIDRQGISNTNALVVETELAIIGAADEVNVLADHSKLCRRGMSFLCGLERIARLITDAAASQEFLRFVRDQGIEVLQAGGGGDIR